MRKEINISEATIIKLQRKADKEKRSLKAQMEHILVLAANEDNFDKQVTLHENIKIVSRKKEKQ